MRTRTNILCLSLGVLLTLALFVNFGNLDVSRPTTPAEETPVQDEAQVRPRAVSPPAAPVAAEVPPPVGPPGGGGPIASKSLILVTVLDEEGGPFPSSNVAVDLGEVRTAPTDSSGQAIFELDTAGHATIVVSAEGYCTERREGIACSPGFPAEVSIQLLRPGRLVIKIVGSSGEPVPNARITLSARPLYMAIEKLSPRFLAEKLSDSDGLAIFDGLGRGTWWIRAISPRHWVQESACSLAARESEKTVTVTLEDGIAVRVVVRDADTLEPVPGLCVAGHFQSDRNPRLRGSGIGFLFTDDLGEIRFCRPPDAGISLHITHDPIWYGAVLGSRHETELVIEAVKSEQAKCVLMVDGARYFGSTLIEYRQYGSEFTRSDVATPGPDGCYVVDYQGIYNSPVFRFRVTGKGASDWRNFRSKGRLPRDPFVVDVRAENVVSGRVVGVQGQGIAGALVAATDIYASRTERLDFEVDFLPKGFSRRKVLTRADGAFDLPLPQGDRFRVTFDGGDLGFDSRWVDTKEKSGSTVDLGTIRLAGTGTVRVRVTRDGVADPFGYVWLEGQELQDHTKLQLLARTRPDGLADFLRVPPGTYRLWAAGPQQEPPEMIQSRINEEVKVSVTAGTIVDQSLPLRTGFWPR